MTSDLPPRTPCKNNFCECYGLCKECTVDKAEHERLKKELEELDDAITETWYNKGIIEGERRAMQKVKETIDKYKLKCVGWNAHYALCLLEKELGLGGEEKR